MQQCSVKILFISLIAEWEVNWVRSLGNSNANDRSAHFAAVDQISNAENKIWLCSRNHRTMRNNGSDKLKHFHEDLSPRLSLLLTHRHTANGHISIDKISISLVCCKSLPWEHVSSLCWQEARSPWDWEQTCLLSTCPDLVCLQQMF